MKSLKEVFPALLVFLLFTFLLFPGNQDSIDHLPNSQSSENGQVPYIETFQSKIHFEPNYGQCMESVDFVTRGKGYSLFLEPTEILLLLQNFETYKLNHIRLSLKGANPETRAKGFEEQQGKSNYFIGNNPEQWYTDIPNYAKIKYEDVYSGIDLAFYGNEGELEYDFIVSPRGNPKDIMLKYDSEEQVRVDKTGNLVLGSDHSKLIMRAPIAYQEEGTDKKPIDAEFKLLADNSIVFDVGKYDTSLPLVIDPIIVYSTYLGGSEHDYGTSIAVDDEGCLYVAGKTTSLDFPTENAYQDELHPAMFNSISDVFVSKFSASGNRLIYSTYIGGRWDDEANGIAVDSEGRACITGRTSSDDDEDTPEYEGYPLMNAYQTEPERNFSNAFVTVLSASGNSLEYSSYLGGKMEDWAEDISLDPSGNIYIVGTTFSASFPTKNAFMPNCPSGYFDAFVAKFDPYLSGEASLIYSTYLGGDLDDWGNAIAVDQQGCAYVTGQCKSTDWPVTENAIQSSRIDLYEAYITKLSASGTELEYSTYLGSEGSNEGLDIEVDSEGHAYVSGYGGLGFYTTPGAFKTTTDFGGNFFSKLKQDGSGFVFSTYMRASTFTLDEEGQAYFVATTRQAGTSGEPFIGDVYLLVLNNTGSDTLYSYAFGGSESDFGSDIKVDDEGNLYIMGSTSSTDFPVMNAYQPIHNGKGETFVTKLMPGDPEANLTVNPDPIYFTMIPAGQVSREPVDVVNASNRTIEISNIEVEPTSLFTVEELPDFPVKLSPGKKLEIQIAFSPGGTKSTEEAQNSGAGGTLTIVSDAENPITTVPIILSGIIINLASDESDANPSDGICDVKPEEDGLQVTLRAAIEHVNAMGFDEVTNVSFDIPGDGQPVIQPVKFLPMIEFPIYLDASTQDWGSVALDGTKSDDWNTGLILVSSYNSIKGLHVKSFGKGGISIASGQENTVSECEITENGTKESINSYGILVRSNNNTISNNVISNNYYSGVRIHGEEAYENLIEENMIGTEASGMHAEPNTKSGILITAGANHNYIQNNVVSGNEGAGILVTHVGDKSPTHNVISENYIGVGKDGKKRIGNTNVGIILFGTGVKKNTIEANIISGNHKNGITIYAKENTVISNWIGTDITETMVIPNFENGIEIVQSSLNTIKQNTIAANKKNGISISMNQSKSLPPMLNLIANNYIGVSRNGYNSEVDLGNLGCGISLEYSIPSVIENEIADNEQAGVLLKNCVEGLVEENAIYKNAIGVDVFNASTVVVNNGIFNNTQGIVVNGEYADGESTIVALNDIFANGGDQTGIHVTDGTANICGNFILDDNGNAITVEGNSDVSVTYNDIMMNEGYGLENLSDETEVYAQNNYWGDETGPGGVGPGTGDEVSEGVDYSNWLDDAISIFASAESDTILAPIGRSDSLILIVGDINSLDNFLGVTISDELEWITSSDYFEFETKYDSGYVDYLYFDVPEDVVEGTISRVDLNASSLWYAMDGFNSVFYIKAIESVLEYFAISPDTVEIEAGTSMLFEATGYDQFYQAVAATTEWTCTGGTIEEGLYMAGEVPGTYLVTAEELSTGLTSSAQVMIIPKLILTDNKLIEVPLSKSYIQKTYPNPFNGSTTINFYLEESAHVSIKIYNLMGQEIEMLERTYLPAGEHETVWQPKDLPGGIYICKFQLSNRQSETSLIHVETRKLLLIK